jgi:hypothetical protein
MGRIAAIAILLLCNFDFALAQDAKQESDTPFAERYDGGKARQAARGFGGFYAVGLGGYEFGSGGPVDTYSSNFNSSGFSQYLSSVTPTPSEVKGAFAGAAAGYNFQSGALLIGFETRGYYSFAEAAHTYTNTSGPAATFPYLQGSCSGSAPLQCFTNVTNGIIPYPIDIQSTNTITSKIERNESFDVSTRLGGIIQDTLLLYGRLGGGAEFVKVTQVNDLSGTRTCNNPTAIVVSPNAYTQNLYATGCGSITNGPVIVQTTNAIAPFVTLGLGVEKNFGNFFARAEGEFIAHFAPVNVPFFTSMYYSTRVTGGVGYRF